MLQHFNRYVFMLHIMLTVYLGTIIVNIQLDALFNVFIYFTSLYVSSGARGGVVVKALRYKPAGRGFDSRCYHWNFSVT
jgi:hypothetical protein